MAENTQVANTQNDGDISMRELLLSFGKWWRYLLSKWYIILAFGVLGGLLGIWYSINKEAEYTATTTFVLETGDGGRASQFAGLAAMAGIDMGGGGGLFQGENILELYKSRTMIVKTLLTPVELEGKTQLLIDRYIQFTKMREKWSKRPDLKNIRFTESGVYPNARQQIVHDSILSSIVRNINNSYLEAGKIDKKLNIIEIIVKAKDELFAKAFNERLVENVNEFYLQTKTRKGVENVVILQQKVDSVRGMMTGAIYRAAAVADATPNLNPTRQVQRAAPIQTATASADVNRGVLAELVKNLEMSKISLQKETPLIQVVDEPVLPLDVKRVGKLFALIVGGILGGIIIIVFLITRKMVKNILQSEVS